MTVKGKILNQLVRRELVELHKRLLYVRQLQAKASPDWSCLLADKEVFYMARIQELSKLLK